MMLQTIGHLRQMDGQLAGRGHSSQPFMGSFTSQRSSFICCFAQMRVIISGIIYEMKCVNPLASVFLSIQFTQPFQFSQFYMYFYQQLSANVIFFFGSGLCQIPQTLTSKQFCLTFTEMYLTNVFPTLSLFKCVQRAKQVIEIIRI